MTIDPKSRCRNTRPSLTAKAIATMAFIGFFPFAPGTAASAASLPLALAIAYIRPWPVQVLALLLLIVPAVLSAHMYSREIGQSDPRCIVIDETAGMVVTLAFIAPTIPVFIAGFFLFRFFDVLKPFPIQHAERLPGGIGIVADDIAAGIASNLVLRILLCFFPVFCKTCG